MPGLTPCLYLEYPYPPPTFMAHQPTYHPTLPTWEVLCIYPDFRWQQWIMDPILPTPWIAPATAPAPRHLHQVLHLHNTNRCSVSVCAAIHPYIIIIPCLTSARSLSLFLLSHSPYPSPYPILPTIPIHTTDHNPPATTTISILHSITNWLTLHNPIACPFYPPSPSLSFLSRHHYCLVSLLHA